MRSKLFKIPQGRVGPTPKQAPKQAAPAPTPPPAAPPPRRIGEPIYPFDGMKIGDSFFWPVEVKKVSAAACQRKRRTNEMYVCRFVIENGVRGTLCRRVA